MDNPSFLWAEISYSINPIRQSLWCISPSFSLSLASGNGIFDCGQIHPCRSNTQPIPRPTSIVISSVRVHRWFTRAKPKFIWEENGSEMILSQLTDIVASRGISCLWGFRHSGYFVVVQQHQPTEWSASSTSETPDQIPYKLESETEYVSSTEPFRASFEKELCQGQQMTMHHQRWFYWKTPSQMTSHRLKSFQLQTGQHTISQRMIF